MKRIAAVIFVIVVLFVSVSLSEELSPGDPSEGSRLVGLLITREDLSESAGEAGVILASCTQEGPDAETEYHFGDVSGLRLICFVAPEDDGEGSCIISNVDDGISDVDFDLSEDGTSIKMDATIHFVPEQNEELFFYNPVLRADSGQVFAVPETVREPLEIRLLQFSANHEPLESAEYKPGALPEKIIPLAGTEYILLETVEKDLNEGSFIRREVFSRDVDFLNTMSCREDGICLCHYHEILWNAVVPEGAAVKNTIAGNMKTYRELTDGTWMCDGSVYKYRLEIKGRMPNAAMDSTFVYLSNIENISFEQAYLAGGLSSNLDDYFSPADAVLVEMY